MDMFPLDARFGMNDELALLEKITTVCMGQFIDPCKNLWGYLTVWEAILQGSASSKTFEYTRVMAAMVLDLAHSMTAGGQGEGKKVETEFVDLANVLDHVLTVNGRKTTVNPFVPAFLRVLKAVPNPTDEYAALIAATDALAAPWTAKDVLTLGSLFVGAVTTVDAEMAEKTYRNLVGGGGGQYALACLVAGHENLGHRGQINLHQVRRVVAATPATLGPLVKVLRPETSMECFRVITYERPASLKLSAYFASLRETLFTAELARWLFGLEERARFSGARGVALTIKAFKLSETCVVWPFIAESLCADEFKIFVTAARLLAENPYAAFFKVPHPVLNNANYPTLVHAGLTVLRRLRPRDPQILGFRCNHQPQQASVVESVVSCWIPSEGVAAATSSWRSGEKSVREQLGEDVLNAFD